MPTSDEKRLEKPLTNECDFDNFESLNEELGLSHLNSSVLLEEMRRRTQNTIRELKELEEMLSERSGNSPDVLRIVKSTAADLSQFRETYRNQSSHTEHRDTCLAAGGLAMVVACLVVMGTNLFGADDTAALERQIAYLQNTVKYVAKEQGVSFPQPVRLAPRTLPPSRPPRIVIDPPVIIEREVSRQAVPEAIFKNEAVADQPVTVALEPAVEPPQMEAGRIIKFDQAAGAGQ